MKRIKRQIKYFPATLKNKMEDRAERKTLALMYNDGSSY